VVVAGGKYTTYRVMAKDAVDAVVHALDGKVPPCVTERIPVIGAEGFEAAWNRRHRIAEQAGVHVARIEHLLGRYGSLIGEVLAIIDADGELGRPLEGAEDYLAVEVAYAASHEGARHLDDVLARRTHISIEMWDRGVGAAPHAARIMAGVLGWSEDQISNEVRHYLARVEAERLSQTEPDDETADATRLGAPEIVPLS
jgi:glycerol-3-phosphate dehydrogenase